MAASLSRWAGRGEAHSIAPMYVPDHFREDRPEVLADAVRRIGFATLVTTGLEANHLPMLLEGGVLKGHVARANPVWKSGDGAALAIFLGPHAYVSPRHYDSRQNVPTWNYVAVHAYGRPVLIEERAAKIELQRKLIRQVDPAYLEQMAELSDSYLDVRLAAIVSFSMEVTRIDARYKLSQDKNPAERERIACAFEASGDSVAAQTARLMREHEPPAA